MSGQLMILFFQVQKQIKKISNLVYQINI